VCERVRVGEREKEREKRWRQGRARVGKRARERDERDRV
jgi:hypothetical protein